MSALRWVLTVVFAVVALFAVYTWIVLTWNYSAGERAGYVQKLSKKGWICKTWEGELAMVSMPGTLSEKFLFSVRDDAVAEQINSSMGRRVSLQYEEHIGVPTTCFAESRYFITGVKIVEDPRFAPPPAATGQPTTPAPAKPAPAPPTAPGTPGQSVPENPRN
jgi:hypothetical protein